MIHGLREDLNRLATGKHGAREDALRATQTIRDQLPIVERLIEVLAGERVVAYKPSIRPVDRLPGNRPAPAAEPAPSIGDLEQLLSRPGQGSPFR